MAAATFVLVTPDGKALMELRSDKHWCYPGGKVEDGESILEALEREMMEEIGCTVNACMELGLVAYGRTDKIGDQGYRMHPFLVWAWTGLVPDRGLDEIIGSGSRDGEARSGESRETPDARWQSEAIPGHTHSKFCKCWIRRNPDGSPAEPAPLAAWGRSAEGLTVGEAHERGIKKGAELRWVPLIDTLRDGRASCAAPIAAVALFHLQNLVAQQEADIAAGNCTLPYRDEKGVLRFGVPLWTFYNDLREPDAHLQVVNEEYEGPGAGAGVGGER